MAEENVCPPSNAETHDEDFEAAHEVETAEAVDDKEKAVAPRASRKR